MISSEDDKRAKELKEDITYRITRSFGQDIYIEGLVQLLTEILIRLDKLEKRDDKQ